MCYRPRSAVAGVALPATVARHKQRCRPSAPAWRSVASAAAYERSLSLQQGGLAKKMTMFALTRTEAMQLLNPTQCKGRPGRAYACQAEHRATVYSWNMSTSARNGVGKWRVVRLAEVKAGKNTGGAKVGCAISEASGLTPATLGELGCDQQGRCCQSPHKEVSLDAGGTSESSSASYFPAMAPIKLTAVPCC